MRSLAGARVLVTGAARGIGAALARECVRRGARVALVGLEPARLRALAVELGPGHLWAEADVTSSAQLGAAVDAAVAAFGGLDVVVTNAGITSYGTIRQLDPEAFARVVDVNLTGMFRTLHASIPALIESGGYALIVSSAAAFAALPGLAPYCASKAGAEALAGSARGELAHLGVGVGSAHPLWVDTDLVRDAEAALPSFRTSRDRLPWPLRATTDLPSCVAALADGIEARAARVYVPRSAAVLHVTRAFATSRLASRVLLKMAATSVPRLEREVEAFGRNLAVRSAE
jgi:NAD(P)-dependent dehydrogenase (short-subunit alcohol dehydrogenase family)